MNTASDHSETQSLDARLTVIIPSYQRGERLQRAIASVLDQTPAPRVLVIDDGSDPGIDPAVLPPKVDFCRLPRNRGGSAARNIGARTATTPWIAFLDDDDEWLPGTAELYDRILGADADDRCCFVSGIEVWDEQKSEIVEFRRPVSQAAGNAYFLEDYPPGASPLTKQTFVLPRRLHLDIGGFDEDLRSRVHSEFALRLNAACRIDALDAITYRLRKHGGDQVSKNPELRHRSFLHIWRKHNCAMAGHPDGAVQWAWEHARRCYREGNSIAAISTVLRALAMHPQQVMARMANRL